MIPKIIHYVWLGNKEMPDEYKNYINKWKELMPDYTFMLWTDKNFDITKSKYSMQAYQNKKWGFVPDYIRVAVLEEYGGIYLDTDVEVVKRFDDLLDNDFFISFENDAYVETAVIGSKPHHQYLKTLMNFYENHSFQKSKNKLNLTPSPVYFTYYLKKHFNLDLHEKNQVLSNGSDTINVYTTDYFAPINFTTKILTQTKNTYTIHHFANSWAGSKQKFTEKFTKGVYKIFGKKIFGNFTRMYLKNQFKKLRKIEKKLDIN